jgi:Xaa-Pro aminopeptidase
MRNLGAVLLVCAFSLGVQAGELQDDLKARRARVMEKLDAGTLFVHVSAPEKTYSHDVEYEFRQDSDLLYLTGIAQPQTTLVLLPGNRTKKELLFIRDADPVMEHREGHRLTKDEARALSGIESVYLDSELDGFLGRMANRRPFGGSWGSYDGEYDAFFDALAAGRARLALVLGTRPAPKEPLTPALVLAESLRPRFLGAALVDASEIVHNLRQVKTPYERAVLQASTDVSSEAHKAGMRAAKPGKWEYEIEAAIEEVYARRGATSWGYPSIVGSGPNATILHYNESRRQAQAGELVLVDASANYQGHTSDITRTWPVSGRYSPEQAELYRLVLAAQEAGMKAAKAGNHTSDVEKAAIEVIKPGLLKLGLITDVNGDQYKTWYTHGICHFIGMDVHDVGDYRLPMAPGWAFVVEPGLYIREQSLENLPDKPEFKGFAEKVRPAVKKYKDIGVRVEDSFLLTETGLVRLSAKAPRTVEEIEAWMAEKN